MRGTCARVLTPIAALGLAAAGLAGATGSAAAHEDHGQSGLQAHLFASGSSSLSAPDDIATMDGAIFVAWQNGVGAQGEPAANGNTQSTIVAYSSGGRALRSWRLTGRVDGMTADPERGRIIATVNEDGNTSLFTIRPDAPSASQVVHYTYSPNPPVHGGGTDAPRVYRGQILISASNPSDTTRPAVYRATLSGTTATLTPVFFDDSTATVANTNSAQRGRQVTLALTDPDSNTTVPGSSPRFGGDFVLDSQGDQQQIYVRDAGRADQRLSVLNLSQSVDDTAWATTSRGVLYATDGTDNEVFAVRGRFDVGTAFTAATPGNANTAPANPGPNFLATLDLDSGLVTPVPGISFQAKGLVFVSSEGDDD
jgi:hypothetical protein